MTSKADNPPPSVMCFAEIAGRSDVERRHRVALITELNRQGIPTFITTLANDSFNYVRLQGWDKLKGYRFGLDDPHKLSQGLMKLRAMTGKVQNDIYWGLDPIGNRYALMAQQLIKGAARVTSIEHAEAPKGLKARIAAHLEAGPEMTVARTLRAFRILTGRGKERALVHLSPGLDLKRIRNRATPGEIKAARKRAEVAADDVLISAWVKDAEPDAIARLAATAEAANSRLCLFGESQKPASWPRNTVRLTADDYLGYLPLVAASNAYISMGSGIEDVLARREATAVGAPVYLFDSETGITNETAGIFAVPVDPGEAAAHMRALNEDSERAYATSQAARAHAEAEYDIREEARRLAALFTRSETV